MNKLTFSGPLTIVVLSFVFVGMVFFALWLPSAGATGADQIILATPPPIPTPTPLVDIHPGSCPGGLVLGDEQPVCCIHGFVYLDGRPVAGATVEITNKDGTMVKLTTGVHDGDEQRSPYYRVANLRLSPLAVERGDKITITARYSGHEQQIASYTVLTRSQQVDLVLRRNTDFSEDYMAERSLWQQAASGIFTEPTDVAIDKAGALYMVDRANARIQVFDQEAGNFVRQWDVPGEPVGIALDHRYGSDVISETLWIYVTNIVSHSIQKFDGNGKLLLEWGGFGSKLGLFKSPQGIAVDQDGYVYVADTGNDRIQKFYNNGAIITATWNSQFAAPQGVAVDRQGYVYVADTGSDRILKFTSSGVLTATWGGGDVGIIQFESPQGVAIDSRDNVYVADTGNHRIVKLPSNGDPPTAWDNQGSGNGQFAAPRGIRIDSRDQVYVADPVNRRIQKFDNDGNFILAWGSRGSGDGQFELPHGIAIDDGGNFYIADTSNNRIQKFDNIGVFITAWGVQGSGQFSSPWGVAIDNRDQDNLYVYVADTGNHHIQQLDGNGVVISDTWGGQFQSPHGIAVDSNGNVYVADTGNDRIQKFDSNGVPISITWGSQFQSPHGIAIDSSGFVYVADTGNHRIQKFASSGAVTSTTWGGQFQSPQGLAVDGNDNVYVADTGNHRIQKFTSEGVLIAEWGWQGMGYGEFQSPTAIAIQSDGHVYVADTGNHRIQPLRWMIYTHPIATISHISEGPSSLPGLGNLKVQAQGQASLANRSVITYHWRIHSLSTNEMGSPTVLTPALLYSGEALELGRLQLTLEVEDEVGERSAPVSTDIFWGKPVFLPIVTD